MFSLAQFLEEIKVANISIGKKGYRMDGTGPNSMRHHANLGSGNCCDYLIKNEESFVLIEETQLSGTIQKYKDAYPDLSGKALLDLTVQLIRDENRLKVFFALLVLCRLEAKYPKFKQITHAKKRRVWGFKRTTHAKKFHVWLVVTIARSNMIVLQHVKNRLPGALGGTIGKDMESFEVVLGKSLKSKISAYAPTY
ncbi:MAG: hypothetical protein IBGAMO2_460002 [Arenicellales bacterium IbO2]|nr:hypothetical protein [Gammaproteobacteria bacterium]MDA8009188.1 hypothetical protein [Alphaproteobacteria bacterium]MDA8030328.1 hypothetical protein [Alphaproteobacteria bacterium]MDA8041313.1 hypothetical protein [Pirellulales bacterium]CAJ2376793.1 MAG: hypothetical protein IBGAMO2_460002 [Arenicellales bacterium IbO2]